MEDKEQHNNPAQPVSQYEKSEKQTIFSDEFLCVERHVNGNWLYANWIGYQSEDQIRKGCEIILAAVEKYGVKQLLNDNSNVVGIWTPAAEWVGGIWVPRIQSAGLTHLAWVYSPSRLSQVSTNIAIAHFPDAQLIKTFYNIGEANAWLLTNKSENK